MSGLPADWHAFAVDAAQGSKVAGHAVARRTTRDEIILEATRVVYRTLGISPNTARKVALALERYGVLAETWQ